MSEISELRQMVEDLRYRVATLEEGLGGLVEPLMRCGFTLHQARMLGILMTRGVVSRDSFTALLYGLDNDQGSERLVEAHLSNVRAKVRERWGIEIQNLRNVGWCLRACDKGEISRSIAELVRA